MQVIHERCAALDVHKKTVVTTMMITQADGSVQEEVRTFLTMTADLLALDDWLRSHHVEVIATDGKLSFHVTEPQNSAAAPAAS